MNNKSKLFMFFLLTMIMLIFGSLQANAQPDYLQYSQPEQVSQPNLFWELIKVVVSLALVLGVAYLIFQFLGKRNSLFMRGEFIKIVETTFIASNKSIAIVEVGNRFLILGLAEQNITLLTEITDNQIIDLLKEKSQKNFQNQPADSFANYLGDFLGKFNSLKVGSQSDNAPNQLTNLENYFQKQMEKIKVSSLDEKKENAEKDELR